jgi:hypothetical protein
MKHKEFTVESDRLIKLIKDAFSYVKPPSFYENCNSIEDFQRIFGEEYFFVLWSDVYHLEIEEIKYVVPFAIEYYILKYGKNIENDALLELFVNQLIKFDSQCKTIGDRYTEIYNSFNSNQSNSIYQFLLFIKKYNLGYFDSFTDKGIAFWSHKTNT